MPTSTIVLVTLDPAHALAHHALRYCNAFCEAQNNKSLVVFFYGDAARYANRLNWVPENHINLTSQWQQLQKKYPVRLYVCVSTALVRGVSDNENATRNKLTGENLAHGFELTGLSGLAEMMHHCEHILQF